MLPGASYFHQGDAFAAHPVTPMTPKAVGTEQELRKTLAGVRSQGWCVPVQELEMGLMSVAALVHDSAGAVMAAVKVFLQAHAVNGQTDPAAFLANVREQLLHTADMISAHLADGS